MSDLMQSIRAYLKTSTNLTTVHVGEDVPEAVAFPFVWLQLSGESLIDELCHPSSIESFTVDIEVVSDDIDQARLVTKQVKQFLSVAEIHSVNYTNDAGETQTIHGFTVDDHDDNYLPRNLTNDERIHVGSLNLIALNGEIVA